MGYPLDFNGFRDIHILQFTSEAQAVNDRAYILWERQGKSENQLTEEL